MISTLFKPLRVAFIVAWGALVLSAGAGPLATPALAQAAQVPAQAEQPDQPRTPHAGEPTTTPAPPLPLSPETGALRSKLDAFKLDLDQKEAALKRRDLSEAELQGLRQAIDPITESLHALIGDLAPKLEAAKARLDQLGPKPKEDDPEEGADVARDRGQRETAVAELDETRRLARTVLIQAEQLTDQVSDRRRALFTRALFERTYGILSPDLWTAVARSFPRDLAVLRIVAQDTIERSLEARLGALLLLGLALGAAVGLNIGRRYLAPRFATRDSAIHDPPRRRRLLAALGVLMLGAVPTAAGAALIYGALDATNILPPRVQPVVLALLGSFAFVAFVNALAHAILAPGRASWRLVPLADTGPRASRASLWRSPRSSPPARRSKPLTRRSWRRCPLRSWRGAFFCSLLRSRSPHCCTASHLRRATRRRLSAPTFRLRPRRGADRSGSRAGPPW